MAAYCGNPHSAHQALACAYSTSGHDSVEKIADLLIRGVDGANCDFIIIRDGQITEVKDRTIKRNVRTSWIGDASSFNRFQQFYQSNSDVENCSYTDIIIAEIGEFNRKTIEGMSQGRRLIESFNLVLGDATAWTVGGHATVAVSDSSIAKYFRFSTNSAPRRSTYCNAWTTIDFGRAEEGAFGCTVLSSDRTDVSAWGLFWHQARQGRVWIADLSANKFTALNGKSQNAQTFVVAVEHETGVRLSHCGSLGQSI